MKDQSQSVKTINWGILGLGKIASKFAADLNKTSGCELYAVASRTLEKAVEFAKNYHVGHAYGSYENLCQDKNIDAIYIATPHSFHLEHSSLCLNHKKAVLCEKPMGIDANEVKKLISLSKSNNALLMEGLWTRFLPSYQFVRQQVEAKALGNLQNLEADFGFKPDFDPNQRLFKKELGGGSLLDIGIYPIFLALSLLGKPNDIKAKASFFKTKVDSSVDIEFEYKHGVKAKLNSTLLKNTPTTAKLDFERGSIIMKSRFHEPCAIEVVSDKGSRTFEFPTETLGYSYEIQHFNSLIRENKLQSEVWSLDDSLMLSETMDKVKELIGLHYR